MARPNRRYRAQFVHPAGATFITETEGRTPCEAKGRAFQQLEASKASDPETYPNDDDWFLDRFIPLFATFP